MPRFVVTLIASFQPSDDDERERVVAALTRWPAYEGLRADHDVSPPCFSLTRVYGLDVDDSSTAGQQAYARFGREGLELGAPLPDRFNAEVEKA